MKALIVDDDLHVRTILSKVLSELGCECDAVSNGRECLQRMTVQAYDSLWLDLIMPEMDGENTVKQLRSHGLLDQTNIVIISGQDDEAAEETLKNLGALVYVRKPLTPKNISSVFYGLKKLKCSEAAGLESHAQE